MRTIAVGAALLALGQTPACAKDLVSEDGRLVHQRLGFSLEDPSRVSDRWRATRVEGAAMTFAGPAGATMSLVEQCGPLPDDLRLLARELLIGVEARDIRAEGPIQVGGSPGWFVEARAESEGQRLEIRTVTRRLGGCSLDWILVAPEPLGVAKTDFERWWASFRQDRPPMPEEGER